MIFVWQDNGFQQIPIIWVHIFLKILTKEHIFYATLGKLPLDLNREKTYFAQNGKFQTNPTKNSSIKV